MGLNETSSHSCLLWDIMHKMVFLDVLRDQSHDTKFWFYEVYSNKEAVAFHKAQAHYQSWADFKASGGTISSVSHKADGVFVGGKKGRYFYVQWFLRCICSIGLPMCLGGIFLLAGYLHFVKAHDFENIVPVWGAWGIWYVPGSRAFHVAWTGVAEVVGGLGLLVGGLERMILMTTKRSSGLMASFTAAGLASDSAAWLFVLVVLMTPANVFMYTHGATFPRDSGPLPLGFHAMRGTVQVVLLAILHRLGEETLEAMLMERA